jgi:hypothetical protein
MLERIASDLVSATEAYACEEKGYQAAISDALRMYFSVIVTTASLKVCSFDPNQITLLDGKIDQSEFVEVPYVRFRKQLSTRQPTNNPPGSSDRNDLVRAKEHTVFVVNSEAIKDFLLEFSVDNDALRRLR